MATTYFEQTAQAVAQVDHFTPANVEVSDIFAIRLTNEAGETFEITYTAAAATVQDVVEGLSAAGVAAAAAGQAPWDEVTCTEDNTKLIVTADTKGVPFWNATTATDGGVADTQTLTRSSGTAVAGPGIYLDEDNWSSQTLPSSGDDVKVKEGLGGKIYGVNASATTLEDWLMERRHSGNIGGDGHPLYLKGNASANSEFQCACTGVARFRIDAFETVEVRAARTPPATGRYGTEIYGVDNNALIVDLDSDAGSVGFGARYGQTSECDTIVLNRGILVVGPDVTETTNTTPIEAITVNAGELRLSSRADALTINGGTVYVYDGDVNSSDTTTVTTITMNGGRLIYNATGGPTTITLRKNATFDLGQDPTAKTIADVSIYSEGVTVIDPYGFVTDWHAYGINFGRVNAILPVNQKWTKGTVGA